MSVFSKRLKYLVSKTPFLGSLYRQRIEKAIAGLLRTSPSYALQYMKDFGYGNLPDDEKKTVLADMYYCLKKLNFSYYEYFAYGFMEKKSDEERREFVSNYERRAIIKKLNYSRDYDEIFSSKSLIAEKYADFLKRDYCVFRSVKDVDKLEAFLNTHKRAIIKPLAGSYGRGVRIVDVKDQEDVHALASSLIEVEEYSNRSKYKCYGAIVEEVVVQDDRLAKFHSQSVNTVRITTIRLDSRTVIFEPFLRVGRGGACVDNAGSGGIFCPVDAETGVVYAARDKHGVRYETHPESGVPIVGFQIPRWDEAKEFVRKAAQVVPSIRIIGWDVALSQDGWVLIEANRAGEWLTQEATHTGLRTKITPILRELANGRQ